MTPKELPKKIIITGGGSGGHISAASAIISELRSRYDISRNVLYVGGDLGMVDEKPGNSLEMKTFAKETFKKKYIRAGKLQRSFEFSSIRLLLRTILAFFDSYKIIKDFEPDIVISTGGFVSLPISIVAKLSGAKIYLHEQTAAIGLANKIVSKIATKVFITFPSSNKYFSKEKVIQTGNLVRKEIFNKICKGNMCERLKLMIEEQENLPIVYISGGSLGSHTINNIVKASLSKLVENFQIVIQTGDNKIYDDFENLTRECHKLGAEKMKRVLVTKYITKDEIGFLLNNIDIFMGRAGANTVYEIGVLKIPSIFIPIPWVTHNEQEKNAQVLVDLGLSKIIREGEISEEKILLELKSLKNKKLDINISGLEKIFTTNAVEKLLNHIGL